MSDDCHNLSVGMGEVPLPARQVPTVRVGHEAWPFFSALVRKCHGTHDSSEKARAGLLRGARQEAGTKGQILNREEAMEAERREEGWGGGGRTRAEHRRGQLGEWEEFLKQS